MRPPLWAVFLALLPVEAVARCAPFDLADSVDSVPYIVLGEVTQSNSDELVSGECHPEACLHQFSIRVMQVLKGDIEPAELSVEYDFVHQRPNIDLFAVGDEFVFAIDEVTSDGDVTLFGNMCGRSGLGAEHLDEINQALK